MLNHKSDKELAFLQDLYIVTDWGERFAELVDEHVELPEEGEGEAVAEPEVIGAKEKEGEEAEE